MSIIVLIVVAIAVFFMRKDSLVILASLAVVTGIFRAFFYSYSDVDAAILGALLIACVVVFIHGITPRLKTLSQWLKSR